MDLLEQTAQYIEKNELVEKNEKILLAGSGGPDSQVLLYILNALFPGRIFACHFNYLLRGEDADRDAECIQNFSIHLGVPFIQKNQKPKTSTQLQSVARDLRYHWFSELMHRHQIDKIATGHHFDDQVETLFLNLIRGTGLMGLRGIPVQRSNIIRPLLNFSKKEILGYADKIGIPYRVDTTNATNIYKRNVIRNEVIPILDQHFDNVSARMRTSLNNLQSDASLLQGFVEEYALKHLDFVKNRWEMVLPFPEQPSLQQTFLIHFFHRQIEEEVIRQWVSTNKSPVIQKKQWQMTVHDGMLLLCPQRPSEPMVVNIEKVGHYETPMGAVEIHKSKNRTPTPDPNSEFIDAKDLQWPLELRPWKEGDKISIGKAGKKKISDLLTDEKMDPIRKNNQWVLLSDNEIVWVIGRRLNPNFYLTHASEKILHLKLIPQSDQMSPSEVLQSLRS